MRLSEVGLVVAALALGPWLGMPRAMAFGPCSAAQFGPSTDFATGLAPTSVAVGDFNGDGKSDLAVANAASNDVTILLGNGSGAFAPAAGSPVAAGSGPVSVAVGDFNGDGQPDLAVANPFLNTVSVLLNNGGGSFVPAAGSPFASGGIEPRSLAVADFNGDGIRDLAVANFGSNTVLVLLNDGSGGFGPAAPVGVGSGPLSVAVGDFNGDSKRDLAVANFLVDTVTVLLGNGNGTFAPAAGSPFATGTNPTSVAVGDFNGNAKLDLAVTNQGSNTVSVLLGNGNGTFNPKTDFGTGSGPFSVAVADFNGDGKPDLVTANQGGNVSVLLNNGSGGFNPKADFVAGTFPVSVAVGDFNGDGKPDLSVANQADNTVSVLLNTCVGSADLSVTKTDSPDPVTAGTDLTYTLTATNAGVDNAANVTLSDPLPAGTTFRSLSAPVGWTCTTPAVGVAGTVSCTNPLFGVSSAVFTLVVRVASSTASGTVLTNTATISSTSGDPNPGNNSGSTTTAVTTSADLAITKTGPASAVPGTNLVYTVTVTNNGPSDAASVNIADPTPVGLTFVSNSGDCTTAYPCSLGTVAAGTTRTITSTYALPSSYAGPNPIQNMATVSSTTPDPTNANNGATASTPLGAPSADLAITKTGPTGATPGTNLVYSITVTNNGPSDAANVAVNDPTPVGLTFVSNSGACTTPYPCALGTLVAGAVRTVTTTYAVPSGYSGPNPIQNAATVSSTTPDPNPSNNSAIASPSASGSADLAITKTGPGSATPGANLVYTVTVTNNGPSDAASVSVADPTPTGLTFVSNAGACVTPYPCALGSVPAGATRTITTTYAVPSGYSSPNPIQNTATVSSSTPDPSPANNSATASTPLGGVSADLSIAKTGPPNAIPGTDLVYTIVVTNNGPSDAAGVSVADTTPSGLTFVSNSGACVTPYPCALGTLPAGATRTITTTFAVPVGYSSPDPIQNTATVSSTTADPSPSNNTATAGIGLFRPPIEPQPERRHPRKLTEEQREQRQHTNQLGLDDYRTEGNVVEVHLDAEPPFVVIGMRDGLQVVRLACGSHCPQIQVGDYLEADGVKIDETLFEAENIKLTHPGR